MCSLNRYFAWQKSWIFLLFDLVEMAFAHGLAGQRVPEPVRFWKLTTGLDRTACGRPRGCNKSQGVWVKCLAEDNKKMNELRLHLAQLSFPDRWGEGSAFRVCTQCKYPMAVCVRTTS